MKKTKISLFILIGLVCLYFTSNFCYAGESIVHINSLTIPEDAKQYAEENVTEILASVIMSPLEYGLNENFNDLTLGEGYTIFLVENTTVTNSEIYYFPILQGEEIKLILSVYKINNEWNSSLGKDIANELNGLDDEEYILYSDNSNIYAESSNRKLKLLESNSNEKKDSEFVNLSLKDKEKRILNKFNTTELEEVNPYKIKKYDISKEAIQIAENKQKFEYFNKIGLGSGEIMKAFSTSSDYLLSVDFTNCAVNQKDQNGIKRGMCWASSVASIVRCLTSNDTLMAYNVCDKMGIDYDIGASANVVKNALAKYGVTYSVYSSYGSWTQIYNKINAGRPISMACISRADGHIVTIWACQLLNSSKYIHFYNSGTDSACVTSYNGSNTTFSYNNMIYTWVESIW